MLAPPPMHDTFPRCSAAEAPDPALKPVLTSQLPAAMADVPGTATATLRPLRGDTHGPLRVLLLGGTTAATAAAHVLHGAGVDGVFSYAGVTRNPIAQPLPTRIGGFGGVAGMVDFVRRERITHIVDATHPFAAQISAHACAASAATGVPLLALERPPWQPQPGDRWTLCHSWAEAACALPAAPSRVFLAVGRLQLGHFAAHARHRYLLRLVNPVTVGELPLPAHSLAGIVVARGPFTLAADRELLLRYRVQCVVSKNAGGSAARSKIDAARQLGLPVIMVQRPQLPDRPSVQDVGAVLDWLG